MRKILLVVIALFLLAIPLSAQEDSQSVFVRVAHFPVDAGEVDIYVNSNLTLESLAFPDVSEWLELEPGTYTIAITPAGVPLADSLLEANYDLSAGDWVTLAVTGELSRDTLAIQALVEDLGNIPDGSTTVSTFHAIADLEPVNIFAGDIDLVRLLSYPGVIEGSDGFASENIVAGDYNFDIQNEAGESLLSLDSITLGGGRAYFLAVVGTAQNPLYVFVPTDVESMIGEDIDSTADVNVGDGTLLVRIAHLSVSSPEVDVYLNGEPALESMSFGDITDYLEFPAGIYDVALVPTGEPLENSVYDGQIALVADSITFIAAIGFIEDGSLEIVTAPESNTPPGEGATRVALFQAIPGIELFDLRANDNILLQGLSYPDAFEGAGDGYASVDIIPAQYEFVVEGAGSSLNAGNITTGNGRVYLIVSTGTELSPVFFLFSADFPGEE